MSNGLNIFLGIRICTNCGYKGWQASYAKGSFGLEIILWFLFGAITFFTLMSPVLIIPGLYSLWRMFSGYRACPKCKAPNMVRLDSPRGIELMEHYYPEKLDSG